MSEIYSPSSTGFPPLNTTLTFASAGSLLVTHGLNTLTPVVQASVASGATRWSGAAVDADTYRITAVGAMVATFTFLGGIFAAVAPAITLSPAAWSGAGSGTTCFTAAASGSPCPTVQWQTDSGSNGATWTNIAGATSTTYTAPAAGRNGWQYRAIFTNASGSGITSPASVTVTGDTTSGLANYWPMNEGSGSTFIDSIAGNNLAATGIAWSGTEASFTQPNGWATAGSGAQTSTQPAPLNNSTTPFTLSTWVKIQSTSQDWASYMVASSDGQHSGYIFGFFNGGQLGLIVFNGSTAALVVLSTAKPPAGFTTGTRQNLMVTYDGSGRASGIGLYVNGVQLATTIETDTPAGVAITPPALPFTVMGEPLSGQIRNSVPGTMDHLRIYNRVLTSGEIALIQTGGN